jgi:transmembrane sensor
MKKDQFTRLIDDALTSEKFSGLSEPERADAVFHGVMARVRVVKMRTWLKKTAAAASILVLLGLGTWVLVNKQPKNGKQQGETIVAPIPAPDKNRAAIILADGSTVYLDSVNIGQQFTQGNTSIRKAADGKVIYTSGAGGDTRVQYNTLTNPRGSRVIDLALADGSHVWLNAGSSIRYPVVFTGKERTVTVSGEAYFEVAHDKHKPFKVSKGNMEVEVLGTHFNVNAYDDEPDMRVTLLEGKVKVSATVSRLSAIDSRLLKPGQQAIMTDHIKVTDQISIEQIMAWKNGIFNFQNKTVPEIMRQIARWYDVTVKYEGRMPDFLVTGEARRDNTLNELVTILQRSGVYCSIEGKQLVVKP